MNKHTTIQAAQWLETLDQANPEQREAFVDWIRASPEHLHEFLFAMTMKQELAAVDWERMPLVQAVLDKASTNVVSFPAAVSGQANESPMDRLQSRPQTRWSSTGDSSSHTEAATPAFRRRPVFTRIAASLALFAVLGIAWWTLAQRGDVYTTAIGEQRTVELDDGSVVNLSTRSRIEVSYSREGRDIRLDGEAMFKVNRDPQRPFRVHSGNAVVQAVGTQFNVHRRPSGTTVAVVEGAVRVYLESEKPSLSSQQAALGTPAAPLLRAGEAARVHTGGQIEKQTVADIASLNTWRPQRLVFRGNTLEDIATEFNRWNRRQIRLMPGSDQGQLYDGAFDANEPESLLDFLARDPQLMLERRSDELVIKPAER